MYLSEDAIACYALAGAFLLVSLLCLAYVVVLQAMALYAESKRPLHFYIQEFRIERSDIITAEPANEEELMPWETEGEEWKGKE